MHDAVHTWRSYVLYMNTHVQAFMLQYTYKDQGKTYRVNTFLLLYGLPTCKANLKVKKYFKFCQIYIWFVSALMFSDCDAFRPM